MAQEVDIKLFNTLTRTIVPFHSIKKGVVGMYTCGPTVYQRAHIGNLRSYVMSDIVKRTLLLVGFRVRHILNITDVGHLTDDADEGEDKMEREATAQHCRARDIAREYTKLFFRDMKVLGVLAADAYPRATGHIKEQIAMIGVLERKKYTYRTNDGIYFDSSKIKDYGVLTGGAHTKGKAGARVAIGGKRGPYDFVLWKFSPTGKKRQMEWKSPWGVGFPGWHIECSAMSAKYLPIPFDIHTGGIDHIPVHHTNEIAQTKAATGKLPARYWIHGAFLTIGSDARMGKSEGNAITLSNVEARGFSPLDLRYLFLSVHYRRPLNFRWEALEAAAEARRALITYMKTAPRGRDTNAEAKLASCFFHDFHTPNALAFLWKLVRAHEATRDTMLWADHVFGLSLWKESRVRVVIPAHIRDLVKKRQIARGTKDWKEADAIRAQLANEGWAVMDTPNGPFVHKLSKGTSNNS